MSRIRYGLEQNSRSVIVEISTLDRLEPHARRRGISRAQLVRDLLETLLDENLIDAVMDDKE